MLKILSLALLALSLTACGPGTGSQLDFPTSIPPIPTVNPLESNRPAPRSYEKGALIYQGVATAFGDAEAIVEILENLNISYQIYNSSELNNASLDEITKFGMIIWPGGYAGRMSKSLTQSTRERIRQAV